MIAHVLDVSSEYTSSVVNRIVFPALLRCHRVCVAYIEYSNRSVKQANLMRDRRQNEPRADRVYDGGTDFTTPSRRAPSQLNKQKTPSASSPPHTV